MNEEIERLRQIERRMKFLHKMNGAIYFTNIGQAHCVEINQTGQDQISKATLDEAIDEAIAVLTR